MRMPGPSTAHRQAYGSRVVARWADLLAATDRFIDWWGAHRAWPANEPARVERADERLSA